VTAQVAPCGRPCSWKVTERFELGLAAAASGRDSTSEADRFAEEIGDTKENQKRGIADRNRITARTTKARTTSVMQAQKSVAGRPARSRRKQPTPKRPWAERKTAEKAAMVSRAKREGTVEEKSTRLGREAR